MAKGVGLDIGEYEIKVVELDGSLKKPRLTKVNIDLADHADPTAGAAGRAVDVLHVLKDAGLGRDNISVAFPCREAVLRTLTVPFVGEENIRKVLKFEVEGSIHSHNVDDMVIDFIPMTADNNSTKVLVVAAPKVSLRNRLKSLEGVGIEPENVDLDATALFRTAECLGCFTDPVEGAAPMAEGESARVRLVIDIGARSAAVLVVIGGQLVDMRTLRSGTDAVVDEVVAAHGVTPAIARKLVLAALETGEDQAFAVPALPAAEGSGGEPAEALALTADAVPAQESVAHAFVVSARDRFLERFRRELMRFIASVINVGSIESVWITGGGSLLPGVAEVIGEVCECPPRMLDVLGRLQHGLDEQEAAAINPRIAVAVGLALGMMGGSLRLNFRREDLAFARQFDRLKFPLAVACMLGLFFCIFLGLRNLRQLGLLESEYGTTTLIPPEERKGGPPVRFAGSFVPRLMLPTGWMEQRMERRAYTQLCERLAKADTFEQIDIIRTELEKLKKSEQEKTGYYADLALESGFAVLVRLSEVLTAVEGQLGRYLITDIRLELPPSGPRYVEVVFALRQDFRAVYDAIKQAFTEDASKPLSPFLKVADTTGVEKLYADLEEGEEGAYMTLRVDVKPRFDVFQEVAK